MTAVLTYDLAGSRYVNLTNACNLRCHFCPRTSGDYRLGALDLRLHSQPDTEAFLPRLQQLDGIDEVVFCGYGEPTARLSALLRIGQYVRRRGVPVRLNTNGLGNLINATDIVPLLATAVDSVSVSLNAQNEAVYLRHCRPLQAQQAWPALLEFIRSAAATIPQVTATAIDGLDDVDINACRALAHSLGAGFRARHEGRLGRPPELEPLRVQCQ